MKIPKQKPNPYESYNHWCQGWGCFQKGDYGNAIQNFTKAIKSRKKKRADDYDWRGKAYHMNGNHKAALKDFAKAKKLKDKNDTYDIIKELANDYHYRGNNNYIDKNYDAAIKDFTTSIELRGNKKESSGYYQRGNSYLCKNNYKNAIEDFTKAIELSSEKEITYHRIRGNAYYENGNYDDSIKDFTIVIELNYEEDAFDYYERGKAYYKNGNYKAAIRDVKKSLKIYPHSIDAKKLQYLLLTQTELKKNNKVINDLRIINIHEYLWGPCSQEEFEWGNITILMYYLPNDYIIEIKIEAVASPKIACVTKAYFEKIYKDLENVIEKQPESVEGDDGWQLEIKIGTTECTRELSLWSPSEYHNLETAKLLKIINNIKKKAGFTEWYAEWHEFHDRLRMF